MGARPPRLRQLAGFVLGWLAALWLKSLRVRVQIDARLRDGGERPWVLCFFHGTQFPLLAWQRRKRTVVMVSHSNDGAMQAVALRCLGLGIVRGSSSRGGVRGLAALIRQIKRSDADAAFAVDGPRGPYGKVKEGALVAARATGALLVPMGSASPRAWIARRAWDRFTLPLPFSRVHVVLGAPLLAETTTPEDLEHAITATNELAEHMERGRLGGGPPVSRRLRAATPD